MIDDVIEDDHFPTSQVRASSRLVLPIVGNDKLGYGVAYNDTASVPNLTTVILTVPSFSRAYRRISRAMTSSVAAEVVRISEDLHPPTSHV
jgi:hypothetical protein